MPRIARAGASSLRLDGVRTAAATATAVAALADLPYFVHKWTKQKRNYVRADLSLPPSVFARGRGIAWDRPVVGVGGTRSPTVETFCLVADVVRAIAAERTIVISGGVPGVDLAAHLAACDPPEGSTVAVLANPVGFGLCGHEWQSEAVAGLIEMRGLFLSEYASGCEVGGAEYCERLLARDRIISGLCDVFLVFECNEDSGTVDTARRARAQGKIVICINSMRRTSRLGIEQLTSEFDLPLLDERTQSPREIARHALRAAKGAGHSERARRSR